MRTYKDHINSLPPNGIFVFGSNTQGRHGKGAALTAIKLFEAVYGQSSGLQGKSYGIVTKDLTKRKHPSISKGYIKLQIDELYQYALLNKDKDFYIVYSGKGTNLNGYSNLEMASLFACDKIPDNIIFEEEFSKLIFNI